METRTADTLVHVLLAQAASVSRLAAAVELVDAVNTLTLIETGITGALVDVNFTIGPVSPRLAVTLKYTKY